jgi:hypothetical protein
MSIYDVVGYSYVMKKLKMNNYKSFASTMLFISVIKTYLKILRNKLKCINYVYTNEDLNKNLLNACESASKALAKVQNK